MTTHNKESGVEEDLLTAISCGVTGNSYEIDWERIKKAHKQAHKQARQQGMEESINRARYLSLTLGDCPMNNPEADAGWMLAINAMVKALNKDND